MKYVNIIQILCQSGIEIGQYLIAWYCCFSDFKQDVMTLFKHRGCRKNMLSILKFLF